MMYMTEGGKKSLAQAKELNLDEFYDPMTGIYIIPEQRYDSDSFLQDGIKDLMKYSVRYDANGKPDRNKEFALTYVTHINKDGEYVNGAYDVVIRCVEVFK